MPERTAKLGPGDIACSDQFVASGESVCCEDYPSCRATEAARGMLRAALNYAIGEELISRNVAELIKLPKKLKRRNSWTRR